MTLRLSDQQTEALRKRADAEGRSMQQVVLRAIDDYLERASEDEITEDLARKGAERFSDLLRRLGE
ncbi:ribbon-helix-helix protein, CopG family [Nonomuraea longispora]|uniref:Ribbon-helix-helix protein, CopG family n=2 Tax=Nonomuraea longispora TaxID=1848320 RepID=A0A4R4MUH5_9ACTN|nr:ribbon-helix-helix protein, CopG family [Nonomuraea longispora]